MKILVCPKCKKRLENNSSSLVCENRHNFDISKYGYVNLCLGKGSGGDDREMSKARHAFHSFDYYRCLASEIAKICAQNNITAIVDAGCGEGYYLRSLRDYYMNNKIKLPSMCGIDLSKEAVTLGAKCEKTISLEHRIEYAVCGIFDMPVESESCDCVLSVFAPVPHLEAFRVLKNDGVMIVVSPGERHLEGLKKVLYEQTYDNELTDNQYSGFVFEKERRVEDTINVMGENVRNLFHMTPYYWKTSVSDAEKLNYIENLTTKVEFVIKIYKKEIPKELFGK